VVGKKERRRWQKTAAEPGVVRAIQGGGGGAAASPGGRFVLAVAPTIKVRVWAGGGGSEDFSPLAYSRLGVAVGGAVG
jgi:hypothetical protein